MLQNRHLIIQFIGILVLICGYCLSDQPDSWSLMHINPNPSNPSVISKSTGSNHNVSNENATVSSQNSPLRKTHTPKYFAFEILLLPKNSFDFNPQQQLNYTIALPAEYNYLFFEEINPPPPKAC